MDSIDFRYLLYLFFIVSSFAEASVWNNLNCPAPRAPDNGLSFIFRNGELVHFRCHPGYVMRGKPVAYCVNNVWTEAAPECVPIQKWPMEAKPENDVYHYNRNYVQNSDPSLAENQRQLFNWGGNDDRQPSRQGVYGDGPRRLPLINGIWPSQDHKEQVLALGPQSTPGPKTMVKEEIDIAELRNKQLEELRRQRYTDSKGGKRRQGHKKNRNKKKNSVIVDDSVARETILSLGNTEDGEALSIAFVKPENITQKVQHRHRQRHRGGRKKTHLGGKKYKAVHPTDSGFIISRPSRVDTSGIAPYHTKYQFRSPRHNEVAELRRRPVEQVHNQHNTSPTSVEEYDTSCVEPLYGREVPLIAPQVPNSFVYRYETKKNKHYPFNSYMLVKYRCLSGYVFDNPKIQTVHCKKAAWVGEIPRCIKDSEDN